MFGGLQPWHLIFILIIALLLFGPKQLPELGRSIGKAISEFRGAAKDAGDALKEETEKPSDTKKEESKT